MNQLRFKIGGNKNKNKSPNKNNVKLQSIIKDSNNIFGNYRTFINNFIKSKLDIVNNSKFNNIDLVIVKQPNLLNKKIIYI